MRPSVVLSLMIVAILATAVRGQALTGRRSASRAAERQAAPPHGPVWAHEVRGFGRTPAEAEQAALDNARDELVGFLTQQEPPWHWLPSTEYLRRSRVISDVSPGEAVDLKGDNQPYQQVKMRVEIDSRTYQEMLGLDRHQRMRDRQLLLAKILSFAVAVAGLVAAYYRLESWTQGFCTGLLRALALLGTAAAGFVFWWLL
jgi:hypothetical protein